MAMVMDMAVAPAMAMVMMAAASTAVDMVHNNPNLICLCLIDDHLYGEN